MLENSPKQQAMGAAVSFIQPKAASSKPLPKGGYVRKLVCCTAQFSE